MLEHNKGHQLRLFLAAFLPLGCMLVVCELESGCDPATDNCLSEIVNGAQGYEVSVGCADIVEPFEVTLRAGTDGGSIFSCEQTARVVDPATDGQVTFSTHFDGAAEARCEYVTAPGGVPSPFDCKGVLELAAFWDSSGFATAVLGNALHVGSIVVAAGQEPAGTFDVSATIDCPGFSTTDLPTDGTTIAFEDLLPAGRDNMGQCDIHVSFESSVVAEQASLHTIRVFAEANPQTCTSSSQCPSGLRCGPSGCQTGDAGQSCATSYAPVDASLDLPPLGDCNATAPICTTFARCSAGDFGSGCRADPDCKPGLICSAPIFGTCTLRP